MARRRPHFRIWQYDRPEIDYSDGQTYPTGETERPIVIETGDTIYEVTVEDDADRSRPPRLTSVRVQPLGRRADVDAQSLRRVPVEYLRTVAQAYLAEKYELRSEGFSTEVARALAGGDKGDKEDPGELTLERFAAAWTAVASRTTAAVDLDTGQVIPSRELLRQQLTKAGHQMSLANIDRLARLARDQGLINKTLGGKPGRPRKITKTTTAPTAR